MMTNLKNSRNFTGPGFWLIVISGITALLVFTPYDYQLTLWLRKQKVRWFTDLMADSIFEGEMIGAGDLAIISVIIVLVLYVLSLVPKAELVPLKFRPYFKRLQPFLKKTRPSLGFLFVSGLCSALYLVHTLKWIIGRPRPKLIFREKMAYSEWYEFGDHFVADGIFRGSFPSGHTAAVFLFMSFAYVLINSAQTVKMRFLGWSVGFLALIFAFSMGVARSMSAAHWTTDSIASIFIGWAIAHAIFFWGLRVPEQNEYILRNNKLPPLPDFFEIKICLSIFLACLGLMGLIIGARAVYLNNCPWLIILSPIGLFMIIFFVRKAWKTGFFNKSVFLKAD